MPSSVSCPQCRGKNLRQITPGYYECLDQVIVGMAPPEATGLPHPAPVERPCGARFQVGTPAATPSCAFCGLDSIGTCEGGCARRLCGVHGTSRPPFLCRQCFDQRKAKKAQEEAAARRQAAVARDRNQAELNSILDASEDPEEVAQALRQHEELVDVERCRAAWSRLVKSLALRPTHECVEIVGRGVRFFDLRVNAFEPGRWREVPGSRIRVWRAAGAGSRRHPPFDGNPEKTETFDLFLTAEGEHWRSVRSRLLSVGAGGRSSERIVLPHGRSFATARKGKYIEVPDGIFIGQHDAPKAYYDRSVDHPMNFVRAVAAILGGLHAPSSEPV
jgi:hypothetical protein